MSLLLDIVILSGAVGAGVYGVRRNFRPITMRSSGGVERWTHCASCRHPQHCAEADACMPLKPLATAPWTLEDARRQAQSFIDSPSAFWLDPNLWGDDPNWRERLFPTPKRRLEAEGEAVLLSHGIVVPKHTYRMVMADEPVKHKPAPPCPVCNTGRRTVSNLHGGEATMWECMDCGCEFTRAGETRSSKKRQKYAVLPCGCRWQIVRKQDHEGYAYSRCSACDSEWVPRSDDPSGRSLAEGEKVKWCRGPLPPKSTDLDRVAALCHELADGGGVDLPVLREPLRLL